MTLENDPNICSTLWQSTSFLFENGHGNVLYPLVFVHSFLVKMALDILHFPIEHGGSVHRVPIRVSPFPLRKKIAKNGSQTSDDLTNVCTH